jgi:predicted transcriptional regulator
MITKDQMIEVIQTLLEDATVEDAMDRRYVFSKIERGLQQIREGKGIAHEEVVRKWPSGEIDLATSSPGQ